MESLIALFQRIDNFAFQHRVFAPIQGKIHYNTFIHQKTNINRSAEQFVFVF